MKVFDKIAISSPLPIIDLESNNTPQDGWWLPLSETCKKHLKQGNKCQEFYESIKGEDNLEGLYSCPFGFSTLKFSTGKSEIGVTGYVPTPRTGGVREKIIAKRHPDYKFLSAAVYKMVENLKQSRRNLQQIEDDTIKNYSMALHEIRKLNRIVVQNAERICRTESPGSPENANNQIVGIWKAAELMSRQFEIVEILANESFTELPLNSTIEPYRIFDKCIKLFRNNNNKKIRLSINAHPSYSPKIYACDKTFHIIPTVLIENAIKYSIIGTEIRVNLFKSGKLCNITVMNESSNTTPLTDSIFERGVRATKDQEGSGNGLYVAQLVARQHNSQISVFSQEISSSRAQHTFSLALEAF